MNHTSYIIHLISYHIIQPMFKKNANDRDSRAEKLPMYSDVRRMWQYPFVTLYDQLDLIQYDWWFALENWQASCQFNL